MLNRRKLLTIGGALAFGLRAHGKSPDPDIDDFVAAELGDHSETAGIVAALLDGRHVTVVARGHSGTPENRQLTADTIFEIGSLTKVFTALLLADMSARGEVSMTDPVAKYLPASVRLPQLGAPISLIDLATYTSGLPNIPGNLKGDMQDPYAGYTAEDLYAFLGEIKLKYEPGTHYAYANVGFGLLGIALARRVGKSFEELLVERVCSPLNLDHTRIMLPATMLGDLAQGHDEQLKPTRRWNLSALAGAGALLSSAKDLIIFLKACVGLQDTALAPLFESLLQPRRPTGVRGTAVGLGWFITSASKDEVVWKSGRTGGFSANIAFSTRARRASIVLANGPFDAISLGLKLVNTDFSPRGFGALFS